MTEQLAHSAKVLLLEAGSGSMAVGGVCALDSLNRNDREHLGWTFAKVAEQAADRFLLTTPARSWTYGEVAAISNAVRRRLLDDPSFKTGSRVILLLQNSVEYIAAFYGTMLAGGVVVPLAPRAERNQLTAILQSTTATHVVTQSRILRSRVGEFDDACIESIELVPSPLTLEGMTNLGTGDSLAAIMFTGGTSGTPKGVMLSHRNLIENARSIQQYLQISNDDRPLCVLPFYHAFGNSVLQSHLLSGSHLIIDGNVTFPETLIDAILKHRVTSLSGVPDLFRFLLERSSLEQVRKSDLRYMAVAGGALPHDLALTVAQRIQPAQFVVMYGQTEATARLSYVPPDRLLDLGSGCIGRGVPGVELQVVDEQGSPVAPGEVGDIRARGPNVMLGYWNDPEGTREVIRDGWLHTGDLGAMNSEGWIYHRGRRNALIKIAGYRIHPSDLEDFVVRELPVQQAVVVPFEQQGVGTRLALYARPSTDGSELTTSQIVARCREQLPRHLVPDLIQIVNEFPLNEAMKIDRPRLIAMAIEAAPRRKIAV